MATTEGHDMKVCKARQRVDKKDGQVDGKKEDNMYDDEKKHDGCTDQDDDECDGNQRQ